MTTSLTYAPQTSAAGNRDCIAAASRAAFSRRQVLLAEAFDSLGERGKERFTRDVGQAISKIYKCCAPHSELPHKRGSISLEGTLGDGAVSDVFFGKSEAGIDFAVKTPRRGIWESGMRESVRACYQHSFYFHGELQDARQSEGRSSIWLPFYMAGSLAQDGKGRPMIITEHVGGNEPELYFAGCAYDDIPVPPELVLDIIRQMCAGLSEVHRIGMIHRDVKPSNFLLEEIWADGRRLVRAVLLDFDFVRSGPSFYERRSDGRVTGTPEFVAPEIFTRNRYTKASDVYAFGITIFEMLADMLPFPLPPRRHLSMDSLLEKCRHQHLCGGFSKLPTRLRKGICELPDRMHAGFAKIIDKATRMNPDDRYQCGGEMLVDIEDLAAEEAGHKT